MKKRALALLLCLSMILLVGCGAKTAAPAEKPAELAPTAQSTETAAEPAADYEYPELTIGLSSMYVDPANVRDFNAEGIAQQAFADMVHERSGGKITVKNYWSSVLGKAADTFGMVRDGELEMVFAIVQSEYEPRVGAFNLPGNVDSLEMAWDLMGTLDAPLGKLYYELGKNAGVEVLAGAAGTVRDIFSSKHPIHRPADLSDSMIRTYSDVTVSTYFSGLCTTVNLPMPELYTSLQTGAVDAFEHSSVTAISNNLTDVVKYYSDVHWQWQPCNFFIAGAPFWESLDEPTQKLLKECAQDAAEICYKETLDGLEKAEKFMTEEAGLEIYHLTDEDRAEWAEYGATVVDQLRDQYGADMVDEIVQICNDYRANH